MVEVKLGNTAVPLRSIMELDIVAKSEGIATAS
jgi:hypothetical protein